MKRPTFSGGDDVNDSLTLLLSSPVGFSRAAGDDVNHSLVLLVSAEQLEMV